MVCVYPCVRQAGAALLAALALVLPARAQGPRFLPDDPLPAVPQIAVPGTPKTQNIDALYDLAYNSARYRTPPPTPSLGFNTVGEAPDSGWFTNRIGSRSLSREELKRGGREGGPPEPPFTVVAAKTEGVTPGFRMQDAKHRNFFVKVDPPANPEMATAADVMGALFLHAAGYNVPENYILNAQPSAFKLSPKATITLASGGKYPMRAADLEKVLRVVPRRPDGSIRVMASLSVPGKILGPFRYEGTRSDDPNDLIPHQQRRDLRGYAVFCAWLNNTDSRSLNSLDVLAGKGKDARVTHYLIDFGAGFGSDSDIEKDPRHGREYLPPTTHEELRELWSFGLKPAEWQKVKYPHHLPAAGNFTAEAFDPLRWRPNYPNPAFQRMEAGDAFWAAEKVAAFTDDDIRAIVEEGQFTDPAVTEKLTAILAARRDAVVRAWTAATLPISNLRIEEGQLRFTNLLPQAEGNYTAQWFVWDNAHSRKGGPLGSASLAVPSSDAEYIGCVLEDAARHELTAYFRREGAAWKLVGLDRGLASEEAPAQVAAAQR